MNLKTGLKGIVLNLETDNVGVVLLGDTLNLNQGDIVKRTDLFLQLKLRRIAGRINTIGEPIDGKGPIKGELYEMPLERKVPA